MTIYLAADHAGFTLKEALRVFLEKSGHNVIDCGAYKLDPIDDYPDFISKAAKLVSKDLRARAIILGGSGQGEAMVANRYDGVRCAVFYGPMQPKLMIDAEGHASNDPYSIVKLERLHNDANILSLGARFITPTEAQRAVELFLQTEFSAGERHIRRISKF
jgi:ribose 5-phosphate isomerase B